MKEWFAMVESFTRLLSLIACFLFLCAPPASGQRVGGELDRLDKEWQKAYDNHNFARAIEIGHDLAQRKPGDPGARL
jgi:hypothetical protein